MATPARPFSHRRRFVAGLAVALLVGVGLGLVLLTAARTAERHQLDAREAVVTLRALTDVIERASAPATAPEAGGLGDELSALGGPEAPEEAPTDEGGMGLGDELAALEGGAATDTPTEGDDVRRAVSGFAAAHPGLRSIRVVSFEGIRLEASTDPADTGERAAPRRLEREEKDVYDLGQRLRAAVQENREALAEGGARVNEEIALQELPDGGLALSGPIERPGSDNEVVGMVQIRTARDAAVQPPAPAWIPALLTWLVPVALLLGLGLIFGERRVLLAAAAVILLIAALGFFSRWALGVLEAERRATGQQLAAHLIAEREGVGRLLGELGVADPSIDPTRWDVDLFRAPRELITAEGTLDEGKLGELIRTDAGRLTRSVAVLAVIALVLLAFIGFGAASTVGHNLVEHRAAYAYTLPAMIGMLLLVFFPFFYGIALSFTNANIYNSNRPVTEIWVGIDNFVDILTDVSFIDRTGGTATIDYSNFYWTLFFTIVWTVSNVVIGVTLGLILALILNTKGLRFRALYRVLLILPWALPNYITALIFRGMFHQQFGVINQFRQIVGLDAIAWFDSPLTSFIAVLTTNGWLSFPFMMVVSLGALQSIPADLYEAARVDGASRWQQFTSITLPSLRPALVPAVILSVIWTFNQFNVIYLVSAGQPAGATEILITQAYKLAFEQYRYGYAAAYSTVIFLILLIYGTWQNRVTSATEAVG